MKNKLVKLFSMMLALAMIFALAACTNTNSTTSNESTTAAETTTAAPKGTIRLATTTSVTNAIGMGAAEEFGRELCRLLCGEEKANGVLASIHAR